MPDFSLGIGVVSYPVVYEGQPPAPAHAYSSRPGSYDVILTAAGHSEVLGQAEVIQTGPDTFQVMPLFDIGFPPDQCKFWGAFAADDHGVAVLDVIYLVVRDLG